MKAMRATTTTRSKAAVLDQFVPGDARIVRAVARAFAALVVSPAKRATAILRADLVVSVTRPGDRKRYGRSRSHSVIVTVGKPNYRMRQFIAACKRAGEPLPVKKIQLRGTW